MLRAYQQAGELAPGEFGAIFGRQMLFDQRSHISERFQGQHIGQRGESESAWTQVSHPIRSIASTSASIRDRLIALALYRMASATPGADEAHPQSHSNANPISLLERLYRLRLVSEGEADKTVRPRLHIKRIWLRPAPMFLNRPGANAA